MNKKKANKEDNLAHTLTFAAGTLYAMSGQYADLQGNAAKRKREMWEQAADWLAEKAKEMNQQQKEQVEMETSKTKTLKDVAELVAVGDPDEQGWNKLLVYQKETKTFTLLRNFFMGEWCVDFKVLEYEEGYKVLRKMIVDFQQTMMLVGGWEELEDDRYATINADVLEDEEDA